MPHYDVRATSSADPAVVWSLLADARTWPMWSRVDALDLSRSRGLDPDGHDPVGASRAFRTGRFLSIERISAVDEGRSLSYVDEYIPVMRDYTATIELRPTSAGGTAIRWRGTYRTRGVRGWLLPWYLPRFQQTMVDRLAAHADTLRRE